MKQRRSLDQIGLRLSRQALRALNERGIFVQAAVSLEHQHLAKRYVVRGVESGGAVGDIGRYVTFAQLNGQPIECLHPVEAIGANGLHALVVTPDLVRIEMVCTQRTYEMLIPSIGRASRSMVNDLRWKQGRCSVAFTVDWNWI